MADHDKKIPDDAKPDEGKKEESKIDIKAAALGALAKFWELHLEDLGKDLPGVDQAIKYLRLIGIDSPSKIATLDGVAKFILRESPLLSPQMKDFIEDVTDPFLDRARQLRGPMAPKSMVDKAIADGRHDAEIRAAVWKVVLKKKMTYAELEKKCAKEKSALHKSWLEWTTGMRRSMPKSRARWDRLRDKLEDLDRVQLVMDCTSKPEEYPDVDLEDMSDDMPMVTDEFHAEWATTQARLEYLEGIFKPTLADQAKELGENVVAFVRGEETPATRRLTQRIGVFTSEADAFTKRQEDAITASDKKNGVKKYLLPLWFVALVCVLIFVVLAGLLLTSAN